MDIIKIVDGKPITIFLNPKTFQKGDIILISIRKIYIDDNVKKELMQKGTIEF